MEARFVDALLVAGFTLALFGSVLCLLQHRHRPVFRALGWTLAAATAAVTEDVVSFVAGPEITPQIEVWTAVLWIVGLTFSAPLFWIYVVQLTKIDNAKPRLFWRHLLFPGAVSIYAAASLFFPATAQYLVFSDAYPSPTGSLRVYAVVLEISLMVTTLSWVLYSFAMTRRLLRHRARLKDYYASTENREMRWILVLMGVVVGYWLLSFWDTLHGNDAIPDWIDAAGGLCIIAVTLLWGLRQRPGFVPEPLPEPKPTAPKYENSAMTDEIAARIEGKLHQAMTRDTLHQDANLSLWALARHVGASPNYVSQTLNIRVGKNFFDFVNGYRIEAAKMRLHQTDQSVLDIAYAVGFNSRSSFYTAFKKVTHQTPSEYRKAQTG